MANLTEVSVWESGVYQFATDDPISGGPEGIDNLPHKQLLNRTRWLYDNKLSLTGGVVSGNASSLSGNKGLLDVIGGKSRAGGTQTLTVQSADPLTIPATITSGSSSAVLQLFGGGLDSGSMRGGQIDVYAGSANISDAAYAGGILFRAGRGSGGTAQPVVAALDYTGRFGLGIDKPLAALHLRGAGREIRLSSGGWTAAGAVAGSIGWTTNTSNDSLVASIDVVDRRASSSAAAVGEVRIATRNSAGSLGVRAVVTAEGNFGIGTTAPDARLEVAGGELMWGDGASSRAAAGYSASYAYLRAVTNDGADNYSLFLAGGGGQSDTRGAYVWLRGNEYATSPGELRLVAGNTSGAGVSIYTGGSQSVYVSQAGYLGINDGAPGMPLSVLLSAGEGAPPSLGPTLAQFMNNRTASAGSYIAVIGGTTGFAGIGLGDRNSASQAVIQHNNGTGELSLWANGDGPGAEGNKIIIGGGGIRRTSHPSASDNSYQMPTTKWVRDRFESTLSATGTYQKFPGGMVIQCGSVTGVSADAEVSITFPVEFANRVVHIDVGCDYTGGGTSANFVGQWRNATKTGFTACRNEVESNTNLTGTITWVAIGY